MRRNLRTAPVVLLLLALLTSAWASSRPAAPTAPGASARATTPRNSALALARRDQQDLTLARPDERNLYDLTRRLKLHSLTPIAPYIRTTSPNYSVGRV